MAEPPFQMPVIDGIRRRSGSSRSYLGKVKLSRRSEPISRKRADPRATKQARSVLRTMKRPIWHRFMRLYRERLPSRIETQQHQKLSLAQQSTLLLSSSEAEQHWSHLELMNDLASKPHTLILPCFAQRSPVPTNIDNKKWSALQLVQMINLYSSKCTMEPSRELIHCTVCRSYCFRKTTEPESTTTNFDRLSTCAIGRRTSSSWDKAVAATSESGGGIGASAS